MAMPPVPTPNVPPAPVASSATHASGLPPPLVTPVIPLDTTPVTLTPYAGEYFNIWKFQVQCIFCSRQLLDIVEGREVFDPTAKFPVRQSWL
jgi:hypothetical protein